VLPLLQHCIEQALGVVPYNTGCGKKTSPISNGSYKQIKKDTEKIL
jgi:hypothetical protein